MERLTEKVVCNLPDEVLEKLGIADVPKEDIEIKGTHGETCGETCKIHKCSDCPISKAFEKLAYYEDAEENGLLLRLPCPVGTTVYCIEDECEDIYIEGSDYRFVGEERFDFWMLEQFGKTVFLTKEEAEQALKQMGE